MINAVCDIKYIIIQIFTQNKNYSIAYKMYSLNTSLNNIK